jgi:hypothetical protein
MPTPKFVSECHLRHILAGFAIGNKNLSLLGRLDPDDEIVSQAANKEANIHVNKWEKHLRMI